jgi:WD40 repeat protein
MRGFRLSGLLNYLKKEQRAQREGEPHEQSPSVSEIRKPVSTELLEEESSNSVTNADGKKQEAEKPENSQTLSVSSNWRTLIKSTSEFQKFNNFLKGVRWSPDGTCLLTNSEDNILRVFEVPSQVYNQTATTPQEIYSVLRSKEAESIYDYCWYPLMNSNDAQSCVYLSTSRDQPIHLWDAFTGSLRATYCAHNAMDELTAANSIRFNPSGTKIFAGYHRMIRVFDVNVPGRNYTEYATVFEKESIYSNYNLNGIISCLAFNEQKSTASSIVACGSYSSAIGLYAEETLEPIALLSAHRGGVTHVPRHSIFTRW